MSIFLDDDLWTSMNMPGVVSDSLAEPIPNARGGLPNKPQFRPFEDYLGLCNLLPGTADGCFGANYYGPSLTNDEIDRLFFQEPLMNRTRIDSFGSTGSAVNERDCLADFMFGTGDRGLGYDLDGVCSKFATLHVNQNFGAGWNERQKRERELAAASYRKNKNSGKAKQVCVFCRNNGECESVYASHVLKDAEGRVTCPILKAYTCPICKVTGENAHTIKYCPQNVNGCQQESISKLLRGRRNSAGSNVPRRKPFPEGL